MDLKEFDEELNPHHIHGILITLIHNQGELIKAVSELIKQSKVVPQVPHYGEKK